MEDKVSSELKLIKSIRTRTVIESVIIGAVVGLFVSLYRLSLKYIGVWTKYLYGFVRENPILIIVAVLILALVGYIVGSMLKDEPMISGSGIPQIEGELKGYFIIKKPVKIFVYKFLSGILAIGSGLSLGIEGPSIQLGATAAQIYDKFTKRVNIEGKFLISAGAGAGLAAAFNAPFAGVMFVLEEVHKSFGPILFLSAIGASVTADLMTWIFFGSEHILNVNSFSGIEAKYYVLLIVLGVILGLCGVFYNRVMLYTINQYNKIKAPINIRMIIPFVITLVFALILPSVLGGGEGLINDIFTNGMFLKAALILLIGKFVLSIASFASGTPGGILFPLLTLGALVGVVFGQILHLGFGIDENLMVNLIIVSMAGLFASIVRAPITGLILVCEMCGGTSLLGPLAVVCGIAYLVAESLGSEPIYDSLLKIRLETVENNKEEVDLRNSIVDYVVDLGSPIVGLRLKDVELLNDSKIITIETKGEEIVPNGNTIIKAGDKITAVVSGKDEEKLRKRLDVLCKLDA